VNGHRTIRVHGQVQGVFFRVSARDEARRLGLTGFARNEPDGSVYIEVEGDEQALERFVAWCRQGPPDAVVERVEVQEGQPRGYADFAIVRSENRRPRGR
jgi:acylphosphatase